MTVMPALALVWAARVLVRLEVRTVGAALP